MGSCRVAVKCLGELLTGVPHFNCIHEVLEALIHSSLGADSRCRTYACSALETLLRHTQHTDVMVDAVQMAVDAVRKTKCVCPPNIVYALMVVKFKHLSRDDVDKGELVSNTTRFQNCLPPTLLPSNVSRCLKFVHAVLHAPLNSIWPSLYNNNNNRFSHKNLAACCKPNQPSGLSC